MDEGGGAAATFVAVGVTYLAAEFIAEILVAATVGGILGCFAIVAAIIAGIEAMWSNPLPSARAWCYFVIGSSSWVSFPFILMFGSMATWAQDKPDGFFPGLFVFSCGIMLLSTPLFVVFWWDKCHEFDKVAARPHVPNTLHTHEGPANVVGRETYDPLWEVLQFRREQGHEDPEWEILKSQRERGHVDPKWEILKSQRERGQK
jgi:hypothetical protein